MPPEDHHSHTCVDEYTSRICTAASQIHLLWLSRKLRCDLVKSASVNAGASLANITTELEMLADEIATLAGQPPKPAKPAKPPTMTHEEAEGCDADSHIHPDGCFYCGGDHPSGTCPDREAVDDYWDTIHP